MGHVNENADFVCLYEMTSLKEIVHLKSVCEDYVESRQGYFVYDSVTSTQTGMTTLGDSTDGLNLCVSRLNLNQNEKNPDGGGNGHLPSSNPSKRLPFNTDNMGSRVLKYFKKRLPIIQWTKQYKKEDIISDAIAGITVGLTVIPQGIAYAIVAGLEPQYGLYSAFMGCFVYCIFGSSKDITIGPTAIMALMTEAHASYGPDYAVLLAFLSGIIILSFGILQLGFLIDFISVPVIAGFTSAAAITIASGQVKSLLGLSIEHKSHLHMGIVDGWIDVFKYIETTRWEDALLGIICSVLLLSLRSLNRTNWFKTSDNPDAGPQTLFNKLSPTGQKILSKSVWFLCTARNAVVVVICAMMAGFINPECVDIMDDMKEGNYSGNATCMWTLTGKIKTGLPPLAPPPFSTLSGNSTVPFSEMAQQLGSAIIVIPLIAILESVAIAKAFAGGKPVDASQEMIALGFCNIFGGFVSSMPTTGSFSRTAVNAASGVKSPLGGLFTGGLVILCLAFLIPFCAFIPKATLAAVIITAVIFSVEYEVVMPMWRSKRLDLIPAMTCFLVCLFYELELGILAGVVVQLMFILYNTARPGVHVQIKKVPGTHQEYLYIAPDQGVVFPSVSYVRNLINKAGMRQAGPNIPVVIDCSQINTTDFTAAEGFKAMLSDFGKRNTEVYWLDPSPNVAHTLKSIAKGKFKAIFGDIELGEGIRGVSQSPAPSPATAPLLNQGQNQPEKV